MSYFLNLIDDRWSDLRRAEEKISIEGRIMGMRSKVGPNERHVKPLL